MVAAAIGGASLVTGIYSANKSSKAAASASQQQATSAQAGIDAQAAATQAGIAEQQRQFDTVQKLLAPYASAGTTALTGQQNLLGLNGNTAQQSAIDAIQASPAFTSQLALGENRILANASATGGLRGGNVQGALAQFSPALLAQAIQQQYSNLGGLTSVGQNAAAGVGNAGMSTGNSIASLLQSGGAATAAGLNQIGAAQAGGTLASGAAAAGYGSALTGALGLYKGLGGFSSNPTITGITGTTGSTFGAGYVPNQFTAGTVF